uniref:RING-type E3 ubiquitin transferase n=1 Tax=Lactuca sativa TaxID=4236 RepID=A0A9R1WI94_LACSA|nr:hypothetical protein LSAT_V11C200088280 [Lactuca sativa]
MWFPKTTSNSSIRAGNGQRKGNSIVAVAIDKDKYSQHALKWVVEHLLTRGQTVQCIDVILEGTNIAKALAEYASENAIEYLVLGASSRHGFIR